MTDNLYVSHETNKDPNLIEAIKDELYELYSLDNKELYEQKDHILELEAELSLLLDRAATK